MRDRTTQDQRHARARRSHLNALFIALVVLNCIVGAVLPDHLHSWWLVVVSVVAFAAGTVNGVLMEGDERDN